LYTDNVHTHYNPRNRHRRKVNIRANDRMIVELE